MRHVTASFVIAILLAALAVGQQSTAQDSGIAPPAELEVAPPAAEEVVPAPQGQRDAAPPFGRELDLGGLRLEFGSQGRRFFRNNGDRGISFGLDMAERGINFGLRYANGQATPADARAFGIDMGRRGKAFGLEMRDRGLEFGDKLGGELSRQLPVDGREAEFQETPGDITIDAPPLPLGVDSPRATPESKVYGRDTIDRPVRFRREF